MIAQFVKKHPIVNNITNNNNYFSANYILVLHLPAPLLIVTRGIYILYPPNWLPLSLNEMPIDDELHV
jgi:hypothetical protein